MPDVVKHAWTHRPRSQGGTDPIEVDTKYIRLGVTGNVTAGEHSTDDHYALPYHDDYSEFAATNGGFDVNDIGGVILPSIGVYEVHTNAIFGDTDYATKNFYLGHTFTTDGQTFDDVLGSQTLGGETLWDSQSHDGSGLVGSTVDHQKPEMQLINIISLTNEASAPYTLWPWYYCETASETTTWNSINTYIILVSSTAPTFL